ncbi:DUF3138 family protein [Paucibacter soli]|uniref:DUF3138 family protein n=1 Tax=Paucibacter soli TaxID=3133433 RepID=UPI0030AAC5D8
MKPICMSLLALAAMAAVPARAQTDLVKEVQALRERLAEVEARLHAATPQPGQWGMTPEQAREFSRLSLKAEALEDARDASGLRQLRISGYADPVLMLNRRQNRAGAQFLNPVGDDGYNYDNSYFGSAAIDFQKETESGTRWRFTLVPNRSAGAVLDARSPVHEASLSMPLTDLQTRLIAGQIPDWTGYEYVQPQVNKLITHNLLFDFTIPTAYTGAGLELTRGKWIIKSVLGNVNATRKAPGQKTPTLSYRVDYAKGEFEGFGFTGSHGKYGNLADPSGRPTRFDLLEADAYFIRGDLTLQGQLSWGRQRGAAIAPDPLSGALRDARWAGISVLLAYKLSPRLELVARADHLRNASNGGGLFGFTGYWDPANGRLGDGRNGIGVDGRAGCLVDATLPACSRGANRSALSLGASYQLDLNTSLRFEYRLDHADVASFVDTRDMSWHRGNQVLGGSVVVSF